jgi:hypothetical protein
MPVIFKIVYKEGITEPQLKKLVAKMAEYISFEYPPIWKQLNFMNSKDMLKFIQKLSIYVPFKIHKLQNKLNFEKTSPEDYVLENLKVIPIDHSFIQMKNQKKLNINRVSVELFLWNSKLEGDNEKK